MIFILDNFDSFTYNISQAIQKLRCQVVVRRAHETSCADIESLRPTHVILSPGPGKPRDHPFIFDVLRQFASRLPVLGVCLGMQAMNEWCGGSIQKDAQPIHGKTSAIFHNGAIPFRDLPSPFVAARYHSLVIDRLADDLEVTAWTVGAISETPHP
ncbi:MAG: gamma-glutamyl-gamma-aminobutyrate hydrolase family protein, partial [Deltaproteobacteria bacterium]|nr:gamma-glutamyl-gamma-aminobutyrate hydrolase family protein [Deltaproteobacteria bacterium]